MITDSFAISLDGLEYQRLTVDTVAMNIANSTKTFSNTMDVYKPRDVVASTNGQMDVNGIDGITVSERNVEPKRIYDPSHPYANEDGYILKPAVDSVEEMVSLMTAVRAYQANIQALEASKKIIQWTIDMSAK
ncbi:flagellar basal body rod protein FlgC [Microbulbifer sp. GL-2]|uniref:flagellar basal body rod protein FlgC n=1 Tax=Microbulbifer sp. GL-2 TaxID=2591606 RepID=UPI0011633CBB|nr:flagellar basal body rod protein FlgC [Microbulbifer sp. GL-2]BBM00351.1 flagellar basal-body rod protein FlgC [Microbulbifer sp. GL-2]